MKKHSILITEKTVFLSFLRDLCLVVQKDLEKIERDFSWLQFAEYSNGAYVFLPEKEEQWKFLDKLASEFVKKKKKYPIGKVVDTLSEIINTTIGDVINKNELEVARGLSKREKNFLSAPLIRFVSAPEYIPRHPWIMPIDILGTNKWKAKDLTTRKIIIVKKEIGKKTSTYILDH